MSIVVSIREMVRLGHDMTSLCGLTRERLGSDGDPEVRQRTVRGSFVEWVSHALARRDVGVVAMELLSANDEGPDRIDCPPESQQSNMRTMADRPLCLSIVGRCTAPVWK